MAIISYRRMNKVKKILLSNKKIILCHLVLLICFSAYLVSADFLFDRVFIVNGESQIQDIIIPHGKQNIRSNVEMFQKNRLEWKDVILLSGWAFIEDQSMDGMKVYLVLKSNSSEYIFDTMTFSRWDISQYFYNGTFDLRNSGWRANIPESIVGDDDFQIGYLIRNNSTQLIGDTTTPSFMMSRHYINKTGVYYFSDRVIMDNGESTLQDITLPAETRDIRSNVEEFQKNQLDSREVISLGGFAFIQGESMDGRKVYLVLKSNSSEYVFDTRTSARWDVTQYFYNGTFDLRNSGWRANIPESIVGDDDFQIGYLIRDNSTPLIGITTTPSFMMSRHYINKTGLYWK
jgi:hypothetical protein